MLAGAWAEPFRLYQIFKFVSMSLLFVFMSSERQLVNCMTVWLSIPLPSYAVPEILAVLVSKLLLLLALVSDATNPQILFLLALMVLRLIFLSTSWVKLRYSSSELVRRYVPDS
jgi:hypothetical protein